MLQTRISVKDRVRTINSQNAEASLNLPRPDLNILSPSRLPRKPTLPAASVNATPAPAEQQPVFPRQHGVNPSESIKRRGDAFIQNGGKKAYSPNRRPITELEAGIPSRLSKPREGVTAAPADLPLEPQAPAHERHIVDIYADQDFHEAFGRRQTQRFAHPAAHGHHLPEPHPTAFDTTLHSAVDLHIGGTHPHHSELHDQPDRAPVKQHAQHEHEPPDGRPLVAVELGGQQAAGPYAHEARPPTVSADALAQPVLDAQLQLRLAPDDRHDRSPYEDLEQLGQHLPDHTRPRHVKRQPVVQLDTDDGRQAPAPLRREINSDPSSILATKVNLPVSEASARLGGAREPARARIEIGRQRSPDARGDLEVTVGARGRFESLADRLSAQVDANTSMKQPVGTDQGTQEQRREPDVLQVRLGSHANRFPEYDDRPRQQRVELETPRDGLGVEVRATAPLEHLAESLSPRVEANIGSNMPSIFRRSTQEQRRDTDVLVGLVPNASDVSKYERRPRQQQVEVENPRYGFDVHVGDTAPIQQLAGRTAPRVDADVGLKLPSISRRSAREQRPEADVQVEVDADANRSSSYGGRPQQQRLEAEAPSLGVGARVEIPVGRTTENFEPEQSSRQTRGTASRGTEADTRIDLPLPASLRHDAPSAAPLAADIELGQGRRRRSSHRSSEPRENPFLRATAGGEPLRTARTMRRSVNRSSVDPELDATVRLPILFPSDRQQPEETLRDWSEDRSQAMRQPEQEFHQEPALDVGVNALDPDTAVQARLGDISLDRVQDVLQSGVRHRDDAAVYARVAAPALDFSTGEAQRSDRSRQDEQLLDAGVRLSDPDTRTRGLQSSDRLPQDGQLLDASLLVSSPEFVAREAHQWEPRRQVKQPLDTSSRIFDLLPNAGAAIQTPNARAEVDLDPQDRQVPMDEPSPSRLQELQPRQDRHDSVHRLDLEARDQPEPLKDAAVRLQSMPVAQVDARPRDYPLPRYETDDVQTTTAARMELNLGLLQRSSYPNSQVDARPLHKPVGRPAHGQAQEGNSLLIAGPVAPGLRGDAGISYPTERHRGEVRTTEQLSVPTTQQGRPHISLDAIRAILAANCKHRQNLASCSVCLPQLLRPSFAQEVSMPLVSAVADTAERDAEDEEACEHHRQESKQITSIEAQAQLEGETPLIRAGRRSRRHRHRSGALGHPEQCRQIFWREAAGRSSEDGPEIERPVVTAQIQASPSLLTQNRPCHTCLGVHKSNEPCNLPEPPRLHPDCRHTGRCQELFSIAAATQVLQNARPVSQFVLLGSAPAFRSCSHVQDTPLPAPAVAFTAHGCDDASQCLVCLPHVATAVVPGSPTLQFGVLSGQPAFDPTGHVDSGPLPEASPPAAVPSALQSSTSSEQAPEIRACFLEYSHHHSHHEHSTGEAHDSRPRRVRWEECGPLKAVRHHRTVSAVVTGGKVPETEIPISPHGKDIYHTEQLPIPGVGQVEVSRPLVAGILNQLPEQVALDIIEQASLPRTEDVEAAKEQFQEALPVKELVDVELPRTLSASAGNRAEFTSQLVESRRNVDLEQRADVPTESASERFRADRGSLQDALSFFLPSTKLQTPAYMEPTARLVLNNKPVPPDEQPAAPEPSEAATSFTIRAADLSAVRASLQARGLAVGVVAAAPDRQEVNEECRAEQPRENGVLASPAVRLDAELRRTTGKDRIIDDAQDDCRCGAKERADRCCAFAADLEEENRSLRESLQGILDSSNERQVEIDGIIARLIRGLRESVRGSVEEAALVDRLIEQVESFANVGWGIDFNRLPTVTSKEAEEAQERRAEAFSPPEPLIPSPLNPRRASAPSRRSSYCTESQEEASMKREDQPCGVQLTLPGGEERYFRGCHITIQPWQTCPRTTREEISSGSEAVHQIIRSYTSRGPRQAETSRRRPSGRQQGYR